MRTYTITTNDGSTITYDAETQAEALRAHRREYPHSSVLSIWAGAEVAARVTMAEAE